MRPISLALGFLLMVAAAGGQTVRDAQTLGIKAGEAQSAVVPPGRKTQCPAGRILVTNDMGVRPSVVGRDLDGPGSQTRVAQFDPLPTPADYQWGTNDHDLVTLSNGDVLFISLAFSKKKLDPPPDWWKLSRRGTFGPGARSVMLTFLSDDCGETFHFASEFDPAADSATAFCANPQPFRDDKRMHFGYDMGGSDGPLAKVAPGDDVYITHQCVGNTTQTSNPFKLSNTPINQTLVLRAHRGEGTWHLVATLPQSAWRAGMVPVDNATMAVALTDTLALTRVKGPASATFATEGTASSWGWVKNLPDDGSVPKDRICSFMWASTIVARVPGSQNVLMAIPSSGLNGYGYRIYVYNRASHTFDPKDAVEPEGGGNNLAMHLTAIDFGRGPVLLYWYDIDSKAKTATIRGRFIYGENSAEKNDFVIARGAGMPLKFSLLKDPAPAICDGAYWYGDYLTAGGFPDPKFASNAASPQWRYIYYPIWIEPDSRVHYARVEVVTGEPAKHDFVTNPKYKSKPEIIVDGEKLHARVPLPAQEYSRKEEHETAPGPLKIRRLVIPQIRKSGS